nr:TPA_asm: m69.5 sORF 2 [Murid betaherpesvirus 1]DBA07813.1 TPA_asm: m69.5 sORF 2 [Murid betaherpesvirus 1]
MALSLHTRSRSRHRV